MLATVKLHRLSGDQHRTDGIGTHNRFIPDASDDQVDLVGFIEECL
jgi:hypothetical protein